MHANLDLTIDSGLLKDEDFTFGPKIHPGLVDKLDTDQLYLSRIILGSIRDPDMVDSFILTILFHFYSVLYLNDFYFFKKDKWFYMNLSENGVLHTTFYLIFYIKFFVLFVNSRLLSLKKFNRHDVFLRVHCFRMTIFKTKYREHHLNYKLCQIMYCKFSIVMSSLIFVDIFSVKI